MLYFGDFHKKSDDSDGLRITLSRIYTFFFGFYSILFSQINDFLRKITNNLQIHVNWMAAFG